MSRIRLCVAGLVVLAGAVGVARQPTLHPVKAGAQVSRGIEPPCQSLDCVAIFPADNPWNQDISALPVHANSANFMASIGLTKGLHPDFGTVYNGAPNGIAYVVVPQNQPLVPIVFTAYGNQSDPGPYPVPPNAPIEGGPSSTGDRHVIVIDPAHNKLYEMYKAFPFPGEWHADSGAVFDLTSNALRPEGWTSADAAGLAIFPGLVRYDEVVTRGEIRHALRFTVNLTQRAYIHPATHWASSSTDVNRPPMGLRVRLKASYNELLVPPSVRPIIRAMKKYGLIVADNGSDWYISGAPDPRWNEDDIHTLSRVHGSDFDAVETGAIVR